MIETTVPEINIAELMEKVRAEASRPRPLPPRRTMAVQAAPPPLPAVAMLPAAPNVWIPGAVKSNKERLDRLVETAREKNEGGSHLPKFLRRFFRKQGGYNRAIVDGIAALAKSNQDLTQRMADITVCLGQLNGWLLALHEQSDADANWMKAASPGFARIAALESELEKIGSELESAHASVQELSRDKARAAERVDAVESSANERSAALREALEQVRRETRVNATAIEQTRADWGSLEAALRRDLDNTGTHLRNLQGQVDRMARQLGEAGTHLRNVQGQADGMAQQLSKAATHLRNVQGQVDGMAQQLSEAAIHLRNLQAQTDGGVRELIELKLARTPSELEKDRQRQLDEAAIHLRNLQAQADRLGVHLNNLQGFVEKQTAQTNAIHHGMEQRLNDQAGLTQRIAAFEERTMADATLIKGELSEYGALFRRLLGADPQPLKSGKKSAARSETKALPGTDSFYVAFENRFRGPRSEIKKRVQFYLPFLRKCRAGTSGRPVLDVGCGRGEWLELLKEQKLDAHGVDMNTAMVGQCNARHLKVKLGDALEYMSSLRANSHGAVTGFHIIEHLPFEMLLDLFRQARRILKPGGVAIFESPNCKNLIVGACSFHIDPTHRNPVFPETAELMLAAQGFEKIRIEYLSPVPDVKFAGNTPELATLKDLLYGPQDFGIIASKPSAR